MELKIEKQTTLNHRRDGTMRATQKKITTACATCGKEVDLTLKGTSSETIDVKSVAATGECYNCHMSSVIDPRD